MRLTSDEIEFLSRKIIKTLVAEGKLEVDSENRVMGDLVKVITSWGNCPQPCSPATCPADTNGDCVVNIDDLVKIITSWGDCP